MKRIACLFLLTALVLTLFCSPQTVSASETEGLHYTIMVSSFDNESPETYASWWGRVRQVDSHWTTIMTDILNKTGRFIVVDEKQMQQEAMDEQDFARLGRAAQGTKTPVTDPLSTPQLLLKAKITNWQETSNTGVGAMISSLFGGGGKTVEINMTVYIVDSYTGQTVASTNIVANSNNSKTRSSFRTIGKKSDNTIKAINDAAAQTDKWLIAQWPKIPWSGEVALIKDGDIYVNRGTREGVTNDQIFVVGQPDIIRDPSTGEVLDVTVSEVARIKVITLKEKLSICQVISGNFHALTKGMMIQPTNIAQLRKIPLSGEVTLVKDGNIYVNRGTREGVTNGQVFVVGKPNIIRDPNTGEVLDVTVSEVARIKVITLKEKLSICQVISGNGTAITKGMVIQSIN